MRSVVAILGVLLFAAAVTGCAASEAGDHAVGPSTTGFVPGTIGGPRGDDPEGGSDRPACRALTLEDAASLIGPDADQQDRDHDLPPSDVDVTVSACDYFAKPVRRRVSVVLYIANTDAGRARVADVARPAGIDQPAPAVAAGAVWNPLAKELRVPHGGEAVVLTYEPPKGTAESAEEAAQVWRLVASRLTS